MFTEIVGVFTEMVGMFIEMVGVFTAKLKEKAERAKEPSLPMMYYYGCAMEGKEYLNARFLTPLIPNLSIG